jgi:3-mercaptopyruvate sulfurtransferase SseA
MIDQGYKQVNPLLGGFRAWEDADYPVENK